MSVGYLWSVAFIGACTLFALRPLRQPRLLAGLSFRLGLVLKELPFVALFLLLFSTADMLGDGVGSAANVVLLALAGLVVAGIGVVVARGLRARQVVADALAAAFGASWDDAKAMASPRRSLPWARILLRPFFRRRFDVRRGANLSYGAAGRRNLLDVYYHRSRPTGGPVLIHLHGGGYYGGRKNSQALPLLYRLASQGWVCISANYRLRPAATHPEHLIDYKRVIAWARNHAREYGGDPAIIVAGGSSAGGHMASLAALTPNDPMYQPGFEKADTAVTAVISLGGYYGNYYGQGETSSPLSHVRADAPPFFIAHGDLDTVVPVENARAFVRRLSEVSGNPVVYAELPGGTHAFDLFHSVRVEAVVNGIQSFAARLLSRQTDRVVERRDGGSQ